VTLPRDAATAIPLVLELWACGELASSCTALVLPGSQAPALQELRTWLSCTPASEKDTPETQHHQGTPSAEACTLVGDLAAWLHFQGTFGEQQQQEQQQQQQQQLHGEADPGGADQVDRSQLQLMTSVGLDLLLHSLQCSMPALAGERVGCMKGSMFDACKVYVRFRIKWSLYDGR